MFTFLAMATVTEFSSYGSNPQKNSLSTSIAQTAAPTLTGQEVVEISGEICRTSNFGSDIQLGAFNERIKRHHTEVKIASGAYRNGTCCFLFVTENKDERQLLH